MAAEEHRDRPAVGAPVGALLIAAAAGVALFG